MMSCPKCGTTMVKEFKEGELQPNWLPDDIDA
jgi:hypothetical protein